MAGPQETLLAFIQSFYNSSALVAAWQAQGPDACQDKWTGVTCDSSGDITGIALPYAGLQSANAAGRGASAAGTLAARDWCHMLSCRMPAGLNITWPSLPALQTLDLR